MSAAAIPALTVWQPWASLIVLGVKPFEFRGRPPGKMRGRRIAIHAGARKVRRTELSDLIARLRDDDEAWTTCLTRAPALAILERVDADPSILPLSHVLGTALLGEPVDGLAAAATFGRVVNDSDRTATANWAWPLTAIEPLEPPVPQAGAQGFWPWVPEAA